MGVFCLSAKDVYNRTRLRNLKRAKLKQKEAELVLALKHGDDVLAGDIREDIVRLEHEILSL